MQEQPGAQPAASQPQSQSSGEPDISLLPEGNSQSAVPRVEPRGEEDQPESVSDKDRSEILSAAELTSGTILLRAAQLVDLGRARNHQEDAAGIFVPGDPDTLARKGCLYIIADGMGGHNAGEVASQAAFAEIQPRLLRRFRRRCPNRAPPGHCLRQPDDPAFRHGRQSPHGHGHNLSHCGRARPRRVRRQRRRQPGLSGAKRYGRADHTGPFLG